MEGLLRDIRIAARTLRRQRGFSVVAVLTLALGLGASTAIFSVVNGAMLREFPFRDPEGLAVIWGVAGPERDRRGASYPEVADWRALSRTFEEISIYDETTLNLSAAGEAVQLEAEVVSPGYFGMLGVSPALGRVLLPEDDRPGTAPVVLISHELWQTRFSGDPGIVGTTLRLDDRAAEVVGVLPPGFHGLSFDTEVWAPLLPFAPEAAEDRGSRWLLAVGRLRPGVAPEAARADLVDVARRLEEQHPGANRERSAEMISLREYYLADTQLLLWVLLGAVGLLLLIACANVMNLQLVRGIGRSREVALRFALGADRGRVVRTLVHEALLLAAAGGAVGLLLATWGLQALLPLVPEGVLPAYVDVAPDLRVLGFTFLLVALTGVLSGMLPALRSTRRDLATALRQGAGSTSGGLASGGRFGLQQLVVVAEVALALALMVGAGLMVRSLRAQLDVDPGFSPEGVMAARVSLTADSYDGAATARFAQGLLERVRGLPGVESAAVVSGAPLRGYTSAAILRLEEEPEEGIRYYRHRVTPELFPTLGIPVVRGRPFSASDAADAPPVAIVSAAFAERFWPGREAVGRRLQLGPDSWVTVVGVAADARFRDLTTALSDPGEDPEIYLPFAQAPSGSFDVVVRSRNGALTSARLIQQAVSELDPSVPIYDVAPMSRVLDSQTASARFASFVLGLFGIAALALSAIGLYGVMAFMVGARQREIAVRLAIGASPDSVLRMVLRQGLLLTGVGLAVGLAVAVVGGRFLEGLLYQIRPSDPLTLLAVSALLLATTVVANLLPARRATRVDPQLALRSE